MSSIFDPDTDTGQALTRWWKSLEDDHGGRAELRRAKTETEVIMAPVFHRLLNQLRPYISAEQLRETRLAAIAGLAAHIREDQPGKIAEQMAGKSGGEPLVSALRFRRLLQRDRSDLFTAMIRMIHLMRRKASLCDMATSMYYWSDRTRRDWAYAYYPHVPEKK